MNGVDTTLQTSTVSSIYSIGSTDVSITSEVTQGPATTPIGLRSACDVSARYIAAELLRRKADRSDQKLIAGVPEPVALLFMLHAKYGPLPGLAGEMLRAASR